MKTQKQGTNSVGADKGHYIKTRNPNADVDDGLPSAGVLACKTQLEIKSSFEQCNAHTANNVAFWKLELKKPSLKAATLAAYHTTVSLAVFRCPLPHAPHCTITAFYTPPVYFVDAPVALPKRGGAGGRWC